MSHRDPIIPSVVSARAHGTEVSVVRRWRTILALACGCAAIAACSASTDPASFLPFIGSFTLRAVNDSSVPHQVGTVVVVRGALSIQSNLTYTLSEVDSAAGATTTISSSGTWSTSGNELVLKDNDQSLYLATISAATDTINVQIAGHTSNYTR